MGFAGSAVCGVEAIRIHTDKYRHFAFTAQSSGIAFGSLIFPFITSTLLKVCHRG